MKEAKSGRRRDLLKAAGAGLVAAATPAAAGAGGVEGLESEAAGDDETRAHKPVYLWGCGWNHELPGVLGEVCLASEMRAHPTGTGVGTFRDDVHPEVNAQWRVNRVTRHGNTYTFEGEVSAAQDPRLVGQPVRIVAKKKGEGTGSAEITIGSEQSELVGIGIIAVLVGLLIAHD